ncbi:MAG: molybdopterin-dependent oxidoreductase [Anaerolineae bacterium]|nr:molybdopterin-dependent oxidoreductase [Anaerolineae bacterium]
MSQPIVLHVNGTSHTLTLDPDTPLLYVLRNDLGLKSAKFGCGLGQCGACKVLIDGNAVHACRTPVGSVEGHEIITLEGLGTAEALHPLQQAFIEEGAAQCGFCTSGMIITAKALLDRNPHPSDADIQAAMTGNLCRCGTYNRVHRAIHRAAGDLLPSPTFEVQTQPLLSKIQNRKSKIPESLPRPLLQNPDLDDWVRINTDGTITLFTGKVELGQDLRTSIAMIGADELDVSLARICVVMADTGQTPNEGYTVSSMSLETSGEAIRYATAEVRYIALEVAHEELEAPLDRLIISDGTIADPATGRTTTYWNLFGGKKFGVQVSGFARLKASDAYTIVGRPAQRLDLLAKVTGRGPDGAPSGEPPFVHDLDLPGMLHGRVVRPPNYGARLLSADVDAVAGMPGVIQVVRNGSFLGVVAEREEQAVQAMKALRATATWEPGPALPPQDSLYDLMLSEPDRPTLVVDGAPVDDPVPPVETPTGAAQTLTATYTRPYHMHASLGPSAAVAQWAADGTLTVWTHAQGPYPLRAEIAQVLGLPETSIRVIHKDGPGCYGHNGADDAAFDAVLLARAVPGRPVSLQWMRADEHAWEPYGTATIITMQASLGEQGEVIAWNHDVWGYPHSGRPHGSPGTSGLLAAWYLEEPLAPPPPRPMRWPQSGTNRNAEPLYIFAGKRIVEHFLPDSPLRVSALRGLGAYANIFAIESFVDELAHAAGVDPVEFRLHHLTDERARAVVEAAVHKAGPQPEGTGRGIGFSQYKNRQSYVVVVVDLTVDRDTGHIALVHAVVGADAGQIVNPNGLSSQLEGAFLQSASWTLNEQVTFDADSITSTDWRGYPILRFRDAPVIETVLLNRPGSPFLGVGEGAQGPVAAAIANAVYDAAHIRLRDIPFTPERVKSALEKNTLAL